jgi:citrate lyase beta subunit
MIDLVHDLNRIKEQRRQRTAEPHFQPGTGRPTGESATSPDIPMRVGAIGGIAAAPSRLEALHFGVADYAASNRARTVSIGGLNPNYTGDQWHFALSRLIVACRAYGLRPIDGPFGDYSNPDGFRASARRAAALGCEGKWAIHPSQVELANEVFSPLEAEVDRARRIIDALRQAEAQGRGAVSVDGKMIDAASERMAQTVIAMDEAIRAAATSRA